MLTFDHIAIATTDLAKGTSEIAHRLGVPLQKGGKHAHFGTHNTLLGLGDLYLEVIAKDPDAPETGRPTWFGLDTFSGPTRLANWLCRTPDFANLPADVGKPVALTRDALHWELTVPDDGSLPFQAGYPSLLKWGAGVTPPQDTLTDQGCRLTQLSVAHPMADTLAQMVGLNDPRVTFTTAQTPKLSATIATPNGPVTL